MTALLLILLMVMVAMVVIAYAEILRERRQNVREMPNVIQMKQKRGESKTEEWARTAEAGR
jgi:hypothetical protein